MTESFDGYDNIIDYHVFWDEGTSGANFVELADSTFNQLSYKTQVTLSAGVYYQFKVVAENSIGDSAPSEAKSIIAATIPDAPNAPTLVF